MTAPATSTANFSSERDYTTYRHARREALVIFTAWAVALCWSVSYCYLAGYGASSTTSGPDAIPLVLGMPSWVFWGIAFPWVIADLFTIWLCFRYIEDDDLGEAREGSDVAEDLAEDKAIHPKGTKA